MQSLRIGILGTRGIPNRYGGFEQCAEYLAKGLLEKGHQVWVYCSSAHEYQQPEWEGVQLIHCKDPEPRMGTAGQFIYDFHCFRDARKRKFDVLLQLGYTSSSVWRRFWPRTVNIVNMDGLEWKRSKYSPKVQRFLKMAEKWAAVHADALVADSVGIQDYLQKTYGKPSAFIPYGAAIFSEPDEHYLDTQQVQPYGYDLLIARMEPENNIEMILEGHLLSGSDYPLLIVGNTHNHFGTYLKGKFGNHPSLRFTEGIYDAAIINNLRYYSRLYYHGHSVGGTNPSLLEAMACRALIAAHDNPFNQAVLGEEAFYFRDKKDIAALSKDFLNKEEKGQWLRDNLQKIRQTYNWPAVVDAYERLMVEVAAN